MVLALGDRYAESGRLDKAAQAYGLAVKLTPSNADAHAGAYYSLGVALGKAKRAAQALSAFSAARRIHRVCYPLAAAPPL